MTINPYRTLTAFGYIYRVCPPGAFDGSPVSFLHLLRSPASLLQLFISRKMHNRMAAGWFYSPSQITHYLATRITSLKPPRTKLGNPYHILKELDKHQWLMFLVGFLGWTWDAFDFFTVSLTITEIAKDFGVQNSDVSWVSMLRLQCLGPAC